MPAQCIQSRDMACVGCRPPFSLGIFNLEEARQITDWMLITYFTHFKLYQYAFTSRQASSLTTAACLQLTGPPASSHSC